MGQANREDKVGLQRAAAELIAAESGRAMLWVPVGMGIGIAVYFGLADEPPVWTAAALLPPLALLLTGLARRGGTAVYVLSVAWLAVALGYAAALGHAHRVAAPVLSEMVETGIEGRVVEVGRSASGAPRVLLDRLRLYGVEREDTPARARVALVERGAQAPGLAPGDRIRLQARLFPPGGAVEPGAFDFHRRAHFARIGAVGYGTGPVLRVPVADERGPFDALTVALGRLRARISQGLREMLPGPEGAFAAAIVVGDRSGIDEAEDEALRAANLSHLLAISGLHMGILCGLVFAVVRGGLSLLPGLSLRFQTKKLAAALALVAGVGYLALSGATVPTQRAFAMVAVALVAVLFDRPAITLRALAVAAMVVLLVRPVSLFDAGFQMSFAATVALVATFEALPIGRQGGTRHPLRLVALYLAGIAATSLVAGLATGPFAAYHFNRMAMWGLPANLLALPLMGLLIAPMAAVAGLLAPFGLAEPAVAAMGVGIGGVLSVAETVASWPGAVRLVPAWSPMVPVLVGFGLLWLALWRTRLRALGLLPVAAGIWLAAHPPARPEVLLAPGARLVGVLGEGGRAVDHRRAQGFAAETWLRRDADATDQAQAAARPALEHGRGWARAMLSNGWALEVLHARDPEPADLSRLCRPRTVLVARHGEATSGPCCFIGAEALARLGAVALWPDRDGIRIEGARDPGARLWDREPFGPALSRCG